MPRGDKSKYTDKQRRKADHIAESYEDRGVPEDEAERRAWATVNKDDGGGDRGGSGVGAHTGHPAAHRGGELGGEASAHRPASARSASARKAAETRRRHGGEARQ
jgi:plasmid stabilization system protein ParE